MSEQGGAAGSRTVKVVAGLLALMVGIGGGLFFATRDSGSGDDAAGEIFLSPAADVGPDPYSADPLAAAPDPSLAQPAVAVSTPITVASIPAVTQTPAGKPGLYGGTKDYHACDPQKLVDFLANNPDKAAAWVAALNTDPDVHLADGRPLTVATIPDYVATLTSVVLTEDTRVTNHGFKNGKPTTLQSVLQKGTSVLVDNRGVPRTKCYCGNPLIPPVASKKSPKFTGKKWPDFDPTKVSVIQINPTVIVNFVLKDPKTGKTFTVPAGSTIVPPTGTATTTSTTTASTTAPTSTTSVSTTSASTTVVIPAATSPALSNPLISRDPSGDAFCLSKYGSGIVGYTITVDYSDPDGDAKGGDVSYGGTVEPGATFAGDGASGTITESYCSSPGDSVPIMMVDNSGNTSNTVTVAVP